MFVATDATVGLPLKVGDRARNVRVIGNNLSPVLPKRDHRERSFPRLLPLDVPVQALHSEIQPTLNSLGQELTDFVEVLRPPLKRCKQSLKRGWCHAENVEVLYTT